MKYPIEQFDKLVIILRHLKNAGIDLNINPSQLHYIAFQQLSEGQNHNWIYRNGTILTRAYALRGNFEGWTKVVPETFTFELYPEGCNDSHIETAVKRAVKLLEK